MSRHTTSRASFLSSGVGRRSGILFNTGVTALSRRMPFGFPSAPYSTESGTIGLKFSSIPAISSAFEFAACTCIQYRLIRIGHSLLTLSSSSFVGIRTSSNSSWLKPLPLIQSPGGVTFARSFRRSNMSCTLFVPTRFTSFVVLA